MNHKLPLITLGIVAASSPLRAQPEVAPASVAPSAPADARYCLRVDPIIGSRMETIQCRTRDDWASLEVDVDQEWADNGVRVIGPGGMPA
ncbi:hypothetical protein GCM10022276_20640 [Sphingomonas limnosediminicola]|uniref:Uncharacterized protein n=1 Tax=Sphingomonas limnosediminicola TaxID=940133 RepID=A0ABP7LJV5_9SPHN